jgi:hypothetical protein
MAPRNYSVSLFARRLVKLETNCVADSSRSGQLLKGKRHCSSDFGVGMAETSLTVIWNGVPCIEARGRMHTPHCSFHDIPSSRIPFVQQLTECKI